MDTSFKAFLKKNPDADATSPALKEKCILNFMVLQLRSKTSQKSLSSCREVRTTSSRIANKIWMNEWQMDAKLGSQVADYWRKSGLLQKKACPVTGSVADEHAIYGVPQLWESLTEEDLKLLKLETSREAQAGDEEAMEELANMNKGSLTEGGQDAPPSEKTPAQLQAEYETNIAATPATYLRQYQDHRTTLVVLQAQCEPDKNKSKFSSMLFTDVSDLIKSMDKAVKTLEGMVSKAVAPKVVKKLASDLTCLDNNFAECMKMGQNFGYEVGGSKQKKRKKSTA